MSHKSSAPVLTEYSFGVDYLSEPTSWDTFSGLTVYAYDEEQARVLAYQRIGEFHADIRLSLTEEPVPVNLVPGVVATEAIQDREAIKRSLLALTARLDAR